ncbi:hypothetical protein DLE01_06240, partial [Streptomyces sp. FT05W]
MPLPRWLYGSAPTFPSDVCVPRHPTFWSRSEISNEHGTNEPFSPPPHSHGRSSRRPPAGRPRPGRGTGPARAGGGRGDRPAHQR